MNPMNTKIIMASSALLLGFSGILLTFFPEELAALLTNSANNAVTLLLQIIGAMYFAFGIMNWVSRKTLVGGIYNRPIAIANMTHFMMVGITITKLKIANSDLPESFWVVVLIYLFYAAVFIKILFTTPPVGSSGAN